MDRLTQRRPAPPVDPTPAGRGAIPAGRLTKWLTVAAWLVIAALLVPLGAKLADAEKNDAKSWLPASAETTRAIERAEAAYPNTDQLVAVVAYENPGGIGDADRATVEADRAAFRALAPDGQVGPAVPSGDGRALLVSFPLAGDEKAQTDGVKKVRAIIAGASPAGSSQAEPRPAGLTTALTGSAGAVGDVTDAFSGLDTTLILATAVVVAILLLLTYRSPILWLIPLLSVGIASQVASAAVYLLAKHAGLTVNGQSQGILTVLVFGAGTDYALLLIARYREELHRHRDKHDAMKVALRASFPAVLASAGTVAAGMLCLLVAELNSVRSLGPVCAVGIACAFAAMTTLLPALLVVCGRWLFWPFVPRYSPEAVSHDITEQHGVWGRVARLVSRRPRPIWIGTALVLGVLAIGLTQVQTGITQADNYRKKVGSVVGQEMIARHYDQGSAQPADIYARAGAADAVTAAAHVPGVADVGPAQVSADGQWVHIPAVLADAPDSTAAQHTITRLRTAVHAVPGADALVGGQTASMLDINTAAAHDNRVAMPLILAVVLLVLILLLRALVAPLLLVGSVVLSFAAAFGTATLIYHAIGHPRIDQGLPLLAFLFLVALGVDYTIFLMSRAREESLRFGTRVGLTRALALTGGVITSAGLVLAATFAVLTVLPLIGMLQIGIVVAFGVLLDTLVVRTLLVPALGVTVGRRIWWPGRLAGDRAPEVDQAAGGSPAVEPVSLPAR
jgi:putative drug exporter of the RND superfamily